VGESKNDPDTNDRATDNVPPTDLQHHIFRLTLDDRLCLCPKNDGAKRALDLGTGTGIWCIEYGESPRPSRSSMSE
jgi:ubiquinone/menaquinone biosynthesis C-methylase UbiE